MKGMERFDGLFAFFVRAKTAARCPSCNRLIRQRWRIKFVDTVCGDPAPVCARCVTAAKTPLYAWLGAKAQSAKVLK